MAEVPEAPEGVVDQESADAALDNIFTGDEPPESGTEAPGDKDSPAQPTDDDGPARDEKGRFAKPEESDTDPAPESEEPSPDDAGPESEVSEEGDETKDDGQLSDEEWDALSPMEYRADGQNWQIPGSKVEEDGVFIPTDQIPNVAQLLSEGQSHRGSFRATLAGYDDQIRDLTAELEGERAALTEISDKIEELVTKPGALEEWVENQRQNWDTLKLNAELAKSKRATEHADARRESLEAANEAARVLPMMRESLAKAIKHWGDQAGFKEEIQQQIYNRHATQEGLDRLFPQGENGNRTENFEPLREDMLFLAQTSGARPPTDPTPAPAELKKGEELQKAPTPQRRVRRKAPTTVAASSGKDETPAKEAKAVPKFKTAEEADAWFDAGGYNDLE